MSADSVNGAKAEIAAATNERAEQEHSEFIEAGRAEAAAYGAVNYDPWGKPRIGDWIQTRRGKKFHLLDPHPDDFDIRDIAHALANQCRFTGHTRVFYSVAEHSVRVAELIQSRFHNYEFLGDDIPYSMDIYAALMHDASEAYMNDMARPFKHLPEFKFYRDIEDKLMAVIGEAFFFSYPLPRVVKTADEILLGTEARDLFDNPIDGWHFRYEHLPRKIRPWSPAKAERKFLAMYYGINPLGVRNPNRIARWFNWLAEAATEGDPLSV